MKSRSKNSEPAVVSALNGQALKALGNSFLHGELEKFPENSNRFYPEQLPRFPHEPTRDRFDISYIGSGVGEGVSSLVAFQPGDVVFGISGFFCTEVTLFSLQIAPGLHLHDPYFYGKLLHSCDPNSYVDLERRVFIALKPIQPGEFVTLDYMRTEDYLFRTFPCSCGAPQCRGYVAGRKQAPGDARPMSS